MSASFWKKPSESPSNISLPDLQIETLIFGLHCLDRAVFSNHGEAYRAAFMDQALATTCDAFTAVIPDNIRDDFIKSFQDRYNIRQREYGAMKLVPGDDQGIKGVLSYEYGKRICFDAGVYDPEIVAVMVEGATSIVTMMMKIAKTL